MRALILTVALVLTGCADNYMYRPDTTGVGTGVPSTKECADGTSVPKKWPCPEDQQ